MCYKFQWSVYIYIFSHKFKVDDESFIIASLWMYGAIKFAEKFPQLFTFVKNKNNWLELLLDKVP